MKRMIGVLLAALALDAGTKWLASELLAGRTVALGWLVELRLTRNDGMALGLFAGNRAAGMLLPLAVIFCGWLLLRRYRLTPFTQTACGLVLGGFLGNFLERLWHGLGVGHDLFSVFALVCVQRGGYRHLCGRGAAGGEPAVSPTGLEGSVRNMQKITAVATEEARLDLLAAPGQRRQPVAGGPVD